MAKQDAKPRRSKSNSTTASRNGGSTRTRRSGRRSSARPHDQTAAENAPKGTVPEREYKDYTLLHPGSISDSDEPDVLLDVPVVNVDEIEFELDNLHARVSLHAEVLDLVRLSVGVHAELGKVKLSIKGVEAQALLRVRLDHVTAIIDRVLTTLDRNPQLVKSLGRTVEQLGSSAGHAVQDVGEGAEGAVEDVGEGAGGAVKDVGKGAGGAVQDVGKGAGSAVGDVGEGVGQGAGQALGEVGQGAGQAVGGLGAAGQLLGGGAGQAAGQGGSGSQGDGGGAGNGLTAPTLAKEVAKTVAKELGAAASDEARDLGLAATHKVMELGDRRRGKRAAKHGATPAALQRAEELSVDLNDVEGSGAHGRITVRDVERAQED
jgi:2-oxoacid dehydrogenase-like protein with E3 subunit-binding domain